MNGKTTTAALLSAVLVTPLTVFAQDPRTTTSNSSLSRWRARLQSIKTSSRSFIRNSGRLPPVDSREEETTRVVSSSRFSD